MFSAAIKKTTDQEPLLSPKYLDGDDESIFWLKSIETTAKALSPKFISLEDHKHKYPILGLSPTQARTY
jgi:hypothetical protein